MLSEVLLIFPYFTRLRYNISGTYPTLPLGLAYIASYLERNSYKTEILDMVALRLDLNKIPDLLRNNSYKIVGISCNIFNLRNGIEMARIIKKIKPDIKVVLGGPSASFPVELIFKHSDFDIIVHGEGEEIMLKICDYFINKEGNLSDIESISFRTDGIFVSNPRKSYLDLNKLPFPATHLLPFKCYRLHPPFGVYYPSTIMETSRGCVFSCNFCGLSKVLREKDIEFVMAEIELFTIKYRMKEIHFVDPNFTYNQERTIRLCKNIIKRKYKFAWTCKTRPDLVSDEVLFWMKRAGCYMISYGVESGSNKMLLSHSKNIEIKSIERNFYLTHRVGIRTVAYILIGGYGENYNTVKETICFIKKICPDFVLFGELLPDPNSSLTKTLVETKKISLSDVFDFYVLEKNIFKENTFLGLRRKDILCWVSLANKSFYFNIEYIFKRLSKLKNIREAINMVKGFYFLCLDRITEKIHTDIFNRNKVFLKIFDQ